jgi:hypothetical protein
MLASKPQTHDSGLRYNNVFSLARCDLGKGYDALLYKPSFGGYVGRAGGNRRLLWEARDL